MVRINISDMISICRICDVSVPEDKITYIKKKGEHLWFRIDCPSCAIPTLVNEKGDLIERTPRWSTLV